MTVGSSNSYIDVSRSYPETSKTKEIFESVTGREKNVISLQHEFDAIQNLGELKEYLSRFVECKPQSGSSLKEHYCVIYKTLIFEDRDIIFKKVKNVITKCVEDINHTRLLDKFVVDLESLGQLPQIKGSVKNKLSSLVGFPDLQRTMKKIKESQENISYTEEQSLLRNIKKLADEKQPEIIAQFLKLFKSPIQIEEFSDKIVSTALPIPEIEFELKENDKTKAWKKAVQLIGEKAQEGDQQAILILAKICIKVDKEILSAPYSILINYILEIVKKDHFQSYAKKNTAIDAVNHAACFILKKKIITEKNNKAFKILRSLAERFPDAGYQDIYDLICKIEGNSNLFNDLKKERTKIVESISQLRERLKDSIERFNLGDVSKVKEINEIQLAIKEIKSNKSDVLKKTLNYYSLLIDLEKELPENYKCVLENVQEFFVSIGDDPNYVSTSSKSEEMYEEFFDNSSIELSKRDMNKRLNEAVFSELHDDRWKNAVSVVGELSVLGNREALKLFAALCKKHEKEELLLLESYGVKIILSDFSKSILDNHCVIPDALNVVSEIYFNSIVKEAISGNSEVLNKVSTLVKLPSKYRILRELIGSSAILEASLMALEKEVSEDRKKSNTIDELLIKKRSKYEVMLKFITDFEALQFILQEKRNVFIKEISKSREILKFWMAAFERGNFKSSNKTKEIKENISTIQQIKEAISNLKRSNRALFESDLIYVSLHNEIDTSLQEDMAEMMSNSKTKEFIEEFNNKIDEMIPFKEIADLEWYPTFSTKIADLSEKMEKVINELVESRSVLKEALKQPLNALNAVRILKERDKILILKIDNRSLADETKNYLSIINQRNLQNQALYKIIADDISKFQKEFNDEIDNGPFKMFEIIKECQKLFGSRFDLSDWINFEKGVGLFYKEYQKECFELKKLKADKQHVKELMKKEICQTSKVQQKIATSLKEKLVAFDEKIKTIIARVDGIKVKYYKQYLKSCDYTKKIDNMLFKVDNKLTDECSQENYEFLEKMREKNKLLKRFQEAAS